MRKNILFSIISGVIIFSAYSCLDPFTPASTKANVNLLVVDGFLNSSDGTCEIRLTRTIPLDNTADTPTETGAQVQLEDEDGIVLPLTEVSDGQYTASGLTINYEKGYKLKITTSNSKIYASDLIRVIKTPAIDSVSWTTERTGISVYANTHDANNNTRFYYWRYVETWAYQSAYPTNFNIVAGQIIPRYDDIYHCWQTENSSTISVATSNSLSKDIISEHLLTAIPWASPKLQTKYSIIVEQHALSKEAYDYWVELKKNTENLGTLFDPLPSSVTGNIHCISNPDEAALGYFSAGTIDKKRIFISNVDFKRPIGAKAITGYEGCPADTIPPTGSLLGELPIGAAYKGLDLVGFIISSQSCVDCRLAGGVNVKPDFWE